MSLEPGAQCGPYRVVSLLGAGAMGEVYRAHDPRLGRDVALKVLPEQFSRDAERLRRFEQEARATGGLNHTNILVIYDLGVDAGSPYIASELLEGKTLRELLEAAPLPTRKVIDYGKQIASGLSAAHHKGVVHRDLKPENLFICKDGRVKILDFGLAKLVAPDDFFGSDDQTEHLVSDSATGTGVILGTVGYMAPEQVRGRPADARADIFSFGAVLYEMCSGRRPFRRPTAVETMNAVLTAEPPEIDRASRGIPLELERVTRRCLEKEPERRFQSAADLAFSLEGIQGSSSTAVSAPALPLPSPRFAWATRRFLSLVTAASLVVALLAGIAAVLVRVESAAAQPTFDRLTFRTGNIANALFTPDGQTVVYAAGWEGEPVQLFGTRIESPESRALGLPSTGIFSISRNGMLALALDCRIAWGACVGTLAEMPLSGGAPRRLIEQVDAADWAPDGGGLAVVRATEGRYRVEYPVGNVLFTTPGWISDLRFSPNGTRLALVEHPVIGRIGGNLSVIDLRGEHRVLSSGWQRIFGLAWAPDGGEIWFNADREGNKFDIWASDLEGNERLVYISPTELVVSDISPEGNALLINWHANARLVAVTPGEADERILSWFDWSTVADISTDGAMILFREWGAATDGKTTVYVRQRDGGDAVRLGEGFPLAFSPDERWALTVQGEPPQLAALPIGPGERKLLDRTGVTGFYSATWLPDGESVLFVGEGEDQVARTYLQRITGGPAIEVGEPGILGELVSPDGEEFAGWGGDGYFYLCALADEECWPIAEAEPGESLLQWSEDGESLYLRGASDVAIDIFRLDLGTGERSLWKSVAPTDTTGLLRIDHARLTPDGQTLVYTYWKALQTLYLARGLS